MSFSENTSEPRRPLSTARRSDQKRTFPRTQNLLLTLQVTGDLAVCFLGLCAGYLLRFHTALRGVGVEAADPQFLPYLSLLAFGTIFMVGSFAYLGVYDARLLLRPDRSGSLIIRGTFFWLLLFLSVSLILKFEPPISRIFVGISCFTTLACMLGWRFAFYHWLSASSLRQRLTQQVAFVGWSDDALRLAEAVNTDRNHPYEVNGVILTPADADRRAEFLGKPPLGRVENLERILDDHLIDIVVVVDPDMKRESILEILGICERKYVDFKVVPSFFQTFVSNLRMQTISGVPILGVEEFRVRTLAGMTMKRALDIAGSLVGLIVSAPIIAALAILVKRESPGPVIFSQTRTGRFGEPFTIYKIRSMKLDAENDTGAQWAVENDPRRLKIGAFMREWNLDELPQFWNVLKGEMSLVGPRPERPELIEKFEHEIPHYNPRHEVRPGLTGWAQVNGLRGNTSLAERIRYDLYYIENWSVWFDLQIMLLTFFRRKNAY